MRRFPVLDGVSCSPVVQRREQQFRTILHRAPDTSVIARGDEGGGHTLVLMQYEDLSEGDVARLVAFHDDCQGRLEWFLFADPMGNLLRWSADWTETVWTAGPGVSLRRLDEVARRDAYELTNHGQGWGGITQEVGALGERPISVACMARGEGAFARLRIECGTQHVERTFLLDAAWGRCEARLERAADAAMRISLLTAPGTTVEAAELCAMTQVGGPVYRATSMRNGVDGRARFEDDELTAVASAPGLYQATVRVMLIDEVPAP